MKYINSKIIFLFFFIAGLTKAQSANQIYNTDIIKDLFANTLEQITSQKALVSAISNQANIEQIGNYNSAVINQNFGARSNSNFASIIQNNINNAANITQTGNGNSNKISQDGNGNEAIENVNGNNNTTFIVQMGNNNFSSENVNADCRNFMITQQGDNNTLLKYDNGQSPKALIISQKGNGMHLIITGNSLLK